MRNWLIISYFARIDALAPSHHIDDRLPLLMNKGIAIQLLSSPCGERAEVFRHTRVPSPAPSGIRYEVRYFLRRRTKVRFWFKFFELLLLLPVYPFYFIEKLIVRLDSTWSWFLTASIAAVILSLKNRPEVIYSTGGPVSAHIAAMTASSITRVPHIAEFQDPLVHKYAAPGKFERYIMRKVEGMIFRNARWTVFLSKEAARNAAERNRSSAGTAAIYAGAAPPAERRTHEKSEVFRIAHFGSLGGSRDLDHFLKGLTMLFAERPDLTACVRLELYGNNSRTVTRQIEQSPFRSLAEVKGKVPRQRAVASMQDADALLLIQNTDDVSFETIPSKVYEYLHTGRPILALLYRNAELQAMLEERGHIVVQADDEAGIKRGLETCIEGWKEGRLPCSAGNSPYTVEKAVDELVALAGRVTPCF